MTSISMLVSLRMYKEDHWCRDISPWSLKFISQWIKVTTKIQDWVIFVWFLNQNNLNSAKCLQQCVQLFPELSPNPTHNLKTPLKNKDITHTVYACNSEKINTSFNNSKMVYLCNFLLSLNFSRFSNLLRVKCINKSSSISLHTGFWKYIKIA